MDISKYNLNDDDLAFYNDIVFNLVENQASITLSFDDNSFQIDPCGNIFEVWQNGKILGKFSSIDDLFLNFNLDNLPFILQLSKIDYE